MSNNNLTTTNEPVIDENNAISTRTNYSTKTDYSTKT